MSTFRLASNHHSRNGLAHMCTMKCAINNPVSSEFRPITLLMSLSLLCNQVLTLINN